MAKDLFSENDKQILMDFADTIESGFMRLEGETHDYGMVIAEHGEHIKRGLHAVAKALEHIAEAIEDK